MVKISLLCSVLLFCFGCGGNTDYLAQWEDAREQGNETMERESLLHVIASDNAPEAHYRYAELCRKNESEQGVAAWHFHQFAELLPNAPDSKEALKQAEACEKQQMRALLRKWTGNQYASLEEMTDRLRLIEEHCKTLQKRCEQLEYDNQQLRKEMNQNRTNHGKR